MSPRGESVPPLLTHSVLVSLEKAEDSPCAEFRFTRCLSCKAEGTLGCVRLLTWQPHFLQGPSGRLGKLRQVQLSPMGGTRCPLEVQSLDSSPFLTSKPLHLSLQGSASADLKDRVFIIACKELKEHPPCLQGKLGFRKKNLLAPKHLIFLNQL